MRPAQQAAYLLYVAVSTLIDWDSCFDADYQHIKVIENRGLASVVTPELVMQIVKRVLLLKDENQKVQIIQFTQDLLKDGIDLSEKTVKEILIANDLFEARTKIKRPVFYQSLCHRIPNGLLSIDGSDFTVWLDDDPFSFNVELGVDVGSFAHTAYSIGESETASEVIAVLEKHRLKWGDPIGLLRDHGSANMSSEVMEWLNGNGILSVPAGPRNPKGNGSDEGAFSLIKQVIGSIRLDLSSLKSLARSVLDAVISVYVKMRNRIPLSRKIIVPEEHLRMPVSDEQKAIERQRLIDHKKARAGNESEMFKLDKIAWIIKYHKLNVEPEALKQAMKTIRYYDAGAIEMAETAFLNAVNRRPEVKKLAYFFGILKRIQQERDDEAYRQYCREQYSHKVLSDLRDQKKLQNEKLPEMESIINMIKSALDAKLRFIRDFSMKRAMAHVEKLQASCRYVGPLKKKFYDALDQIKDLSMEEKQRIAELLEQFLNNKPEEVSVT